MAPHDEDDFDFESDSNWTEPETVNQDNTDQAAELDVEQGGDEIPTEGSAVEAPVAAEDKAEAEAAEKAKAEAEAAEKERELTEAVENYTTVVEEIVASDDVDQATGVVPEVLKDKFRQAYVLLPGVKGKSAGKNYLQEKMQEAMMNGASDAAQFRRARSYLELSQAVNDVKKTPAPSVAKPKVDPTEAFVTRIAALMLSPSLVEVPADVKDDWADQAEQLASKLDDDVRKYQAWNDACAKALAEFEAQDRAEDDDSEPELPTAPEVHEAVVVAAKIAAGRSAGKVGRPRGQTTVRASRATGHSGDIAVHVTEVFAKVDSGTFLSIADIAKGESSQYGGDKPAPSQGAISARLFPANGNACTIEGIRPEGKEQGQPKKGAVKI